MNFPRVSRTLPAALRRRVAPEREVRPDALHAATGKWRHGRRTASEVEYQLVDRIRDAADIHIAVDITGGATGRCRGSREISLQQEDGVRHSRRRAVAITVAADKARRRAHREAKGHTEAEPACGGRPEEAAAGGGGEAGFGQSAIVSREGVDGREDILRSEFEDRALAVCAAIACRSVKAAVVAEDEVGEGT